MKITKDYLKKVIKEELEKMQVPDLEEGFFGNLFGGKASNPAVKVDQLVKNIPGILNNLQKDIQNSVSPSKVSAGIKIIPKYKESLMTIYRQINDILPSLKGSNKIEPLSSLKQTIASITSVINTVEGRPSPESFREASNNLKQYMQSVNQLINQISQSR